MKKYEINIGGNKYNYYLSGDTKELIREMNNTGSESYYFIYDSNIDHKIMDRFKVSSSELINSFFIELDVSEAKKNIDAVGNLSNTLLRLKCNRSSCLVAIGGGVLGNIVGLASALLFRGIKFIHYPTTIIAAADSVLSLKQAVNSDYGKNLIGTFYKPEAVFTDLSMFGSLSKRDYNSGVVELVKNFLIILKEDIDEFLGKFKDGSIYSHEEIEWIIDKSIKAKLMLLEEDFKENKKGLALEYGHTVGHAIEFLLKGELKHGEAIALGMMIEAETSCLINKLTERDLNLHYTLLDKLNLQEYLKKFLILRNEEILNILKYDNKRGYLKNVQSNMNYMVILNQIGEVSKTEDILLTEIEEEIVERALSNVRMKIMKESE